MKTILIIKPKLTLIGSKFLIKTKLLQSELIESFLRHAAVVLKMKKEEKLITWSLTHEKKAERLNKDYEGKIGYETEWKSHLIDKKDYMGMEREQYVTSPGIEWPERFIEIKQTEKLDMYLEKHSKTFERFIEAQKELIETKKSGLVEISKLVENQEIMESLEGIKGLIT